jgi:hypothetical protein
VVKCTITAAATNTAPKQQHMEAQGGGESCFSHTCKQPQIWPLSRAPDERTRPRFCCHCALGAAALGTAGRRQSPKRCDTWLP